MQLNLFKRSVNQIGIDFKDDSLRFAKMQGRGRGSKFPCMQILDLPPDVIVNGRPNQEDALIDKIFEVSTQNKWKKKEKVVIGLPSQQVILRHVQMPIIPVKSMRDALMIEFQNSIHLPFENPIFDFVITNHIAKVSEEDSKINEKQMSVIVVAAPNDVVQKYIDIVREADLNPVGVDLTLCALERFAKIYIPDVSEFDDCYMLVNLLWDSIELGIFHQGILYFFRNINIQIRNYKNYENNYSNSDYNIGAFARDLAFEIDRALKFYEYTFVDITGSCRKLLFFSELPESGQILNVVNNQIEQTVIGFDQLVAQFYDMPNDEAQEFASILSTHAVSIGLSMKNVKKH